MVIAFLLVFISMAALAVFIGLAEYLAPNLLWIFFCLTSCLLGWLARCFQLRAPFLPATLVAAWILMCIGAIEDPLAIWLYIMGTWAGFFIPFPARAKGLWDTSMPWISHYPYFMTPLSLAFVLGSFWFLDGVYVGFMPVPSDGGLVSEARYVYQTAFTDMLENNKAHIRIDNQDVREWTTLSSGVYVRKGKITLKEEPPDSLLLIFAESRFIQSGGSLYSRRVRPMHTGLTVSGGLVRLSVTEFEALNLSEFVYRPSH